MKLCSVNQTTGSDLSELFCPCLLVFWGKCKSDMKSMDMSLYDGREPFAVTNLLGFFYLKKHVQIIIYGKNVSLKNSGSLLMVQLDLLFCHYVFGFMVWNLHYKYRLSRPSGRHCNFLPIRHCFKREILFIHVFFWNFKADPRCYSKTYFYKDSHCTNGVSLLIISQLVHSIKRKKKKHNMTKVNKRSSQAYKPLTGYYHNSSPVAL